MAKTLDSQCKVYTLPSPPKFQISLSMTCWPCNPQVLTYNHIKAFSTFVILVFNNWSIVLWKSSISKSEFCFNWPSYPSKIANSKATTKGISARSIPWRMSKKRRTTLSLDYVTNSYLSLWVTSSDFEVLFENLPYNETLSNRIEYFFRQRTDRVLFWWLEDQFCYSVTVYWNDSVFFPTFWVRTSDFFIILPCLESYRNSVCSKG